MMKTRLLTLGMALLACSAALCAEIEPMTAQQRAAAESAAQSAAASEAGAYVEPVLHEGEGEDSQGQVEVAGERMDVRKLIPGADTSKADALMTGADNAGTTGGLRQMYEQRTEELRDNTQERFLDEVMEEKTRQVEAVRPGLESDPGIAQALSGTTQAEAGVVNGEAVPICTTTTETQILPITGTVWDEEVCERIVPNPSAPVCTREYEVNGQATVLDQNERALLDVTQVSNGQVCARTVTVEENRPILSMDRVATLPISSETGGLSCERNRWAETQVTPAQRTRSQALPINQEMGGLSCSRDRWVEAQDTTTAGSFAALLNVNGESGGLSCSRMIWPEGGTGTTANQHSALLNIDGQSPGNAGSRFITAIAGNGNQSGSKSGSLSINGEVGGLSCSRQLVPATGSVTNPGSQVGSLNVDGQTAGELCTRFLWKTTGSSSQGQSRSATLNIDTQSEALLCSRNRWVTGGSTAVGSLDSQLALAFDIGFADPKTTFSFNIAPYLPAGTTSISGFSAAQTNNSGCHTFTLLGEPTQANGWTMWYQLWVKDECAFGFPPEPIVGLSGTAFAAAKTWSVQESGNCAASGTANCSATWACGAQAPTTINGIAVTAAEVQALGALYPSAPGACTGSTLSRVCAGTANTSTSVSIAGDLPGGTTAISGFTFNVSNPQAGVTVTLTQTPAAGNGWTAIFNVARSNWANGLQAPSITMNWTAGVTTSAIEVRETGVCTASGTANCPANWTCMSEVPTSVSGIPITTAEANSMAPLSPGAGMICTHSVLAKACTGTASENTTISIAASLPGNVTSISGFSFTVQNPQAGVTVSLTQTPSAGNGWVAGFSVSRSTWGLVAPARPTVSMSWNATVPTSSVSVQETGSCSDPGSAFCPTQWSCAVFAPVVVGGVNLTTALAQSMAPLYPGAPNTCAEGRLSRVCAGSAVVGSTIGIGDVLPPGTQSITGFAFTVTNPQAGVSVALVSEPSMANGWTATFNVTRTSWGATPADPQITMTWTAIVPSVTLGVGSAGDPGSSGSPNCPTSWTCVETAPQTINGVVVTAAMAASQAPLFPGAPNSCTRASLDRVCSGTATSDTSIAIGAYLAAGTTSISSFAFTVTNPQAGVTVSLLQTPAAANGWVAQFRTSRTGWASLPAQPAVTMTWNDIVPGVTTQIRDSGSCADAGSSSCPASWACTASAPVMVNGIQVTTAMAASHAPLFPGAASTCVTGTLTRTCSGTASNDTSVSIAAQLPGGTTSINNFRFTVRNPQAGVSVSLTQVPTAANGWVAMFRTYRTGWGSTPARPDVLLEWDVPGTSVTFSVRETGNCADPGSSVCGTQWSCAASAPRVINGVAVTAAMLTGETPLFSGASTACVRGNLTRVCTGQATMGASIGVGDLIPAGATSIRNFTFVVNNPQSGVTVSLISAPSLANGWTATFDVVRTNFTVVPSEPQVTVNFEVDEANIVLSMRESGNCADPGSQACPTQWSCSRMAPATVNNQLLTAAMVANEPLLYPGASPSCLTGQLSRVCAGTVTTTAEVAIGDLLPAGTTEIFNFAWGQENITPGVSVELVAAPSNTNGWTARFNVTRNYAEGPTTQPAVRLTWNVYGDVYFEVGHEDSGDCAAGAGQGGEMCRDEWVCDEYAPDPRHLDPMRDYWRMPIRMADPEPWDPICRRGRLVRTCEGTGSSITEVSIAEHLPAGTETISNYRWTVANEIADVGVASLQEPALGNNWVARFETTRADWSTPPAGRPEVLLEWEVTIPPEFSTVIVEEGDCEAAGDAFCKPLWQCTAFADETPGTVTVPKTALRSLAAPVVEDTSVSHAVSLAGDVGEGITTLDGFTAQIKTGRNIALTVTELPTEANGWTVQLTLEAGAIAGAPIQTVNVEFRWTEATALGAEDDDVTPEMLVGATPLFDGAPENCIAARRVMDCGGINEGEVCHDTPEGRWCEAVGGGADTCSAFAQNPNCELVRTVCNEDGMGPDGHCYIESPVYRCSRQVTGENVSVIERTTCSNSTLPVCLDGSCEITQADAVEQSEAAQGLAVMAVAETMRSDWKDRTVYGPGGPPPPVCGGAGCPPVIVNGLKSGAGTQAKAGSGDGKVQDLIPGVGSDDWNPWSMPDEDPEAYDSDPDVAAGMMGNLDPNAIRFFEGKQFNCMRALGGLLNCCTKQVPNEISTDWWKDMMERMRQGWTGVAACSTPGANDPDPEDGGWAQLGTNPSNATLNLGLTSLLENLNGGGETPACENVSNVRMETMTQNFINEKIEDTMPSLKWYCDEDEFDLAAKKKLGACHYLGTYCSSSVFGICIDRRQRYCCFNSPMSLMIRRTLAEQGVATFGTAKRPTCGGVTIQQFSQLQAENMDLAEIEGRLIESGVVGDLLNLSGTDLMARLTGSLSNIDNEGRMSVDARTMDRLGQMSAPGIHSGVIGEVMSAMPTSRGTVQPTPGRIGWVAGTVYGNRGGRAELEVSRDGGLGSVSIQVSAVAGTATAGADYVLAPLTLTWADGDRSKRIVTIPLQRTSPATTAEERFEVRLQNPGGGATIYPTSRAIVIVRPQP